jgi:hypothetical protein
MIQKTGRVIVSRNLAQTRRVMAQLGSERVPEIEQESWPPSTTRNDCGCNG